METTVELTALLAEDPTTSERNRTITMRWPLGPGTNHYDQPADLYLALHVSHHTGSKAYSATLYHEAHFDGMMSTSPFDSINVTRTAVGRYGRSSHQAAADTALAALRFQADDPRILELATTGKVSR